MPSMQPGHAMNAYTHRDMTGVCMGAHRLNASYAVSPTYPALIAVPTSLSDEDVIEGSKFRSKNRLQALSWIHPYNKAS